MPKPSPGSNRYLKAQLRPLTKPVFWASAGLFGLSLFALLSLFRQPNTVLGSGDRDASVNLDDNDSLTPEERARAAEIDDLSVLLKDLDKSKTIDSVSGRLNEAQTTNLEAPEAIADAETSKPSQPVSSGGDFQQLPLLNLSPTQANGTGTQTGSSGFTGFDPRTSGQVGGSATSTHAITPLAAALERNGSTAPSVTTINGTSPASIPGTTSSPNSTTSPSGQRTGALSNGVQPNGSPTYSTPISTPPAPSYNNFQGLTPQNSSNNAYSQILNPNLVVPTAPVSPASLAPLFPAQPAIASPSLGQIQYNPHSNGAIAPTLNSSQNSPTAVFGAPSRPVTAPLPNNPAPYSVPNTTPGQYSGNGRINTFANP